jgi:hypothetical protein
LSKQQEIKADPISLALAAIPVTVQIGGIVILLVAVAGDATQTLFAILVSIIWLKISSSESTLVEWRWLRAGRKLYAQIGNPSGATRREEAYDQAIEETMGIESNVEDHRILTEATTQGIMGAVRSTASFALHAYLVYSAGLFLLSSLT